MHFIKKPFVLYVVAILGLVILAVVTEFLIEKAEFVEALPGDLSTFQEQQVTVFLAIEALLATLSTFIFAAVGTIIHGTQSITKQQLALAISIFFSTAFSIYLGYVCLRMLVWELDTGFLNLGLNVIQVPGFFQIVFLLIATLLLGIFLIQKALSTNP